MSNHNATETVDHVSKALDSAKNEGDQTKALERLQDEIRQDTKDMNPAEQKAYMAQVTKQLEERNQLPILAVAFAGQIGESDKGDLQGELRAVNRAERGGDTSKAVEKAMLQYLINNYDKGANLVEAKNEEWMTDSKISKADVSEKLSQFRMARDEQHRKESNQLNTEKTAKELLGGGDKSLFNFIDRGNNDGKLTKKELQDYLNDARSSGSDSGHFSKAKQHLVENILKEWDNRDKGKWMRGGSMGDSQTTEVLTKQGLVHAAGKKSETDLGTAKAADPAPKPGDPVPKPGDPTPKPGDPAPKPGSQPKASELEVQKGDSYWSISKRILGEKASNAEILAKTKELQTKNGNAPLYYDSNHPHKIKI